MTQFIFLCWCQGNCHYKNVHHQCFHGNRVLKQGSRIIVQSVLGSNLFKDICLILVTSKFRLLFLFFCIHIVCLLKILIWIWHFLFVTYIYQCSTIIIFSGKVENDGHHIPHGDLFELCSCPHYLMEIIIYTSLNVLFIGQHQILLCLWIFVASNQFISAYFVHLWYKERFPNYPKDRKALIPFLF